MAQHRDTSLPIPVNAEVSPPEYPEVYHPGNQTGVSPSDYPEVYNPKDRTGLSPSDYPEVYNPKDQTEVSQYELNSADQYFQSSAQPSPFSKNDKSFTSPHTQSPNPYHKISPPESFQTVTKRKICGLRPWIIVIIVAALVAAILGGVLGGVLGTKSSLSNSSELSAAQVEVVPGPSGGIITVTLSSPVTGTATATATATSTPESSATASAIAFVKTREKFKIPSIAAAMHTGPVRVFVVYLSGGTLKLTNYGTAGWKSLGSITTSNAPKAASPLAIISWGTKNNDNVRIYYFDKDSQLIEIAGDCVADGSSCSWGKKVSVLRSTNIAEYSGLSAICFTDTRDGKAVFQIRVYMESTQGVMTELSYSGGKGWFGTSELTDVMPGTSLAATVSGAVTPLEQKVYYRTRDARLQHIDFHTSGGWTSPSPVSVGSTSTLDAHTPITAVNYINSNDNVIRQYMIPSDKRPIEITSEDAGQSYKTWNDVQSFSPGDDAGGAITAIAWPDTQSPNQVRFYYSKDGSVTEMALQGSDWSGPTSIGS